MAHNDYRPDYDYLWSLGFIETDKGESHPYDRWNEIKLSDNLILHMDCFWDFKIEVIESIESTIPILFGCDEELSDFIRSFNKEV